MAWASLDGGLCDSRPGARAGAAGWSKGLPQDFWLPEARRSSLCPPRTWCNDNLGLIRTLAALGSGSLEDKGGESICPGLILATFPPEAPARLPQVPPPPGLPYPQAQVPLLDPLRRASRSRGGRGTGRAEGPGIPALPWLRSRSQPGPALQAPEPWKVLQAISSCSGAHPPCTVDEGRAAPLLSQVCGRACPCPRW